MAINGKGFCSLEVGHFHRLCVYIFGSTGSADTGIKMLHSDTPIILLLWMIRIRRLVTTMELTTHHTCG